MIYTIKFNHARNVGFDDVGIGMHDVFVDDTQIFMDKTYVESIRFVAGRIRPGDTLHEVYLQGFDKMLTYDELMADKFRLECAAVQP